MTLIILGVGSIKRSPLLIGLMQGWKYLLVDLTQKPYVYLHKSAF